MKCTWCGQEIDVGMLCLTCASGAVYGTEKYRQTKEKIEQAEREIKNDYGSVENEP